MPNWNGLNWNGLNWKGKVSPPVIHLLYLVPSLPLLGFLILVLAGRRVGEPGAGWLATVAVAGSFVVTVLVWLALLGHPASDRSLVDHLFTWLPVGRLQVQISLLADPLSMTMALFVTGVSTLIHMYSIGYMHRDRDFSKFFVYLNLFVASMLILVLGDSLPLTFVGWEGVGACSYFLIAFFYDRNSAASAGKKAFIVNRIGDVGFLLAMFLAFGASGTLSYSGLFGALHSGRLSGTTAAAIALLLFVAGVGKSAQLPLFTWLVDAMEGPTPVSALIHAATMVTAGVYLMVRVGPLISASPGVATTIAIVGLATAFVAATIGTSQDDIKKVLAYSTVSQLGYMMLGVGSGAYVAAIFLMVTHAFYKALLFLSAGSVIHGLHDEQNLKRMGGLRRLMPVTFAAFIVGWFSLAGVPPFSGFWSKGDVLAGAYEKSPVLWAVGVFTALLTAYYMGREVILAFYGQPRGQSGHGYDQEPHESPKVMLVPILVLATAACLGGLLGLPFGNSFNFLGNFLSPLLGPISAPAVSSSAKLWLGATDAVAAIVGVGIVVKLWAGRWNRPELEPAFLRRGWFIDETYDRVVARGGTQLARFSADVVDNAVIDGSVMGLAHRVGAFAAAARQLQSGFVRRYALGIGFGVVIILAFLFSRAVV